MHMVNVFVADKKTKKSLLSGRLWTNSSKSLLEMGAKASFDGWLISPSSPF